MARKKDLMATNMESYRIIQLFPLHFLLPLCTPLYIKQPMGS